METIRKTTGVCPQHDLLYDTLTCQQHLELLGAIKGVSSASLKEQVPASLEGSGPHPQQPPCRSSPAAAALPQLLSRSSLAAAWRLRSSAEGPSRHVLGPPAGNRVDQAGRARELII